MQRARSVRPRDIAADRGKPRLFCANALACLRKLRKATGRDDALVRALGCDVGRPLPPLRDRSALEHSPRTRTVSIVGTDARTQSSPRNRTRRGSVRG
ncbi:MAG: hypothetical protein RL591_2408, partial [Planctomycetota bacterium]